VAPAKPPPMTTTRAVPCAIAGAPTSAAEAPTAAEPINSRRLIFLPRMTLMPIFYRCAWYQSAIASISVSE
jgi:hypothetical protein